MTPPSAFNPGWFMLAMSLIGGLALFLHGLEQLSEGLKHAACDALKTLLTRLNGHRFHHVPVTFGAVVLFLVSMFEAGAQDMEPHIYWDSIKQKGLYEKIWETPTLYEDEKNPVIEYFSLIGRYQGQDWTVGANQGSANGWENRRLFLGAEAQMFQQVTVQAQFRVSEDFNPFYDGLVQAFVKWSPAEDFSLSAGRETFNFAGLERSTSSARIATFERGLLSNQVMPGEVVSAITDGKTGDFSYRAGVFSGSINEEFTDFHGGSGAVAGLGYNLPLFYETGSLNLAYVFNNGNPANNALRPYQDVVSLWHQGRSGPFGLGVDLTGAQGLQGHPAVFGVTVLPTYVFANNVIREGDALQAVARYQFAASDGGNGLQLQRRYEQDVVPNGTGNRYNAVYAGINYLIFGDRFKLMSGVEYSVMHDSANDKDTFNGVTFFTGVRLFF